MPDVPGPTLLHRILRYEPGKVPRGIVSTGCEASIDLVGSVSLGFILLLALDSWKSQILSPLLSIPLIVFAVLFINYVYFPAVVCERKSRAILRRARESERLSTFRHEKDHSSTFRSESQIPGQST